jgi:hypothetical protein
LSPICPQTGPLSTLVGAYGDGLLASTDGCAEYFDDTSPELTSRNCRATNSVLCERRERVAQAIGAAGATKRPHNVA